LFEWDRRNTNVVTVLQEQHGASPARVRDAVTVGGCTEHRTADDLTLVLLFERLDRRLNH
jgi:hypothetical protein